MTTAATFNLMTYPLNSTTSTSSLSHPPCSVCWSVGCCGHCSHYLTYQWPPQPIQYQYIYVTQPPVSKPLAEKLKEVIEEIRAAKTAKEELRGLMKELKGLLE